MAAKTTAKKPTTRPPVKRKIEFSLNGVEATQVQIAGDFTAWESQPVALKKNKQGVWSARLLLAPGIYEYRYLVDGNWADDPNATSCVDNPFGTQNALIVVE